MLLKWRTHRPDADTRHRQVAHSAEESAATLSRLGVAVAVASFAPQLLWGWNTEQTLQLVLPLVSGASCDGPSAPRAAYTTLANPGFRARQ